jgi:hypothetical protein
VSPTADTLVPPPPDDNRASSPRTDLCRGDLGYADLTELLLYAVAGGEEDPARGTLHGVVDDLGALAGSLGALGAHWHGEPIPPATIARALSGAVRRLEVVAELMERAARQRAPAGDAR